MDGNFTQRLFFGFAGLILIVLSVVFFFGSGGGITGFALAEDGVVSSKGIITIVLLLGGLFFLSKARKMSEG